MNLLSIITSSSRGATTTPPDVVEPFEPWLSFDIAVTSSAQNTSSGTLDSVVIS